MYASDCLSLYIFVNKEIFVLSLVTPNSAGLGGEEPINPFVRLELVEISPIDGASELKVELLRGVESGDNLLKYEIFLDGVLLPTKKVGKGLVVRSKGGLGVGNHLWQVKTYIVSKVSESRFQRTLTEFNSELVRLKIVLKETFDLEERKVLERNIQLLGRKILDAKSMIQSQMKELGSPVNLHFEVL